MSLAIQVSGLGKKYQLGLRAARHRTFREAIMEGLAAPARRFRELSGRVAQEAEFWALRDVSFDVAEGEVLGIIGRNGAGKSTLLKVLSRITEPTKGEALIYGRVASLLEVGTGFHNELSGRENVYLNGAILGMSKAEIDRKFEQIVDFSGVEKFLDTPIKRYSSGMKVRLAFAVAAHLEPEILVIDEVLAVGDQEFQNKCLGKMNEVSRSGRTVLFVSHNIAAIEALCTRSILLAQGSLVASGTTSDVLATYLAENLATEAAQADLADHVGRRAGLPVLMRSLLVTDLADRPTTQVPMQSGLRLHVQFELPDRAIHPVLGVVVKTSSGAPIFGIDNRTMTDYFFADPVERGTIVCTLDDLPLMPGRYVVDLYLGDSQRSLDAVEGAATFQILPANVTGSGKLPPAVCGPVFWPGRWTLEESGPAGAVAAISQVQGEE